MQTVPYTRGLPVTQSAPAGHAAAVAKFLGQILPRDASAQHVHDAAECAVVVYARPTALGRRRHDRDQGVDALPQRYADFFAVSHHRKVVAQQTCSRGFC